MYVYIYIYIYIYVYAPPVGRPAGAVLSCRRPAVVLAVLAVVLFYSILFYSNLLYPIVF